MMSKNPAALRVPVEKLRWSCDPDSLGVDSTSEIQKLKEEVIAQERAVSSLKFGIGMKGPDYNIFVAGQPRTGLSYLTRTFVEEIAKNEPAPPDWCYVFNFSEPEKPIAISLPSGRAQELARDMDELLEDLKSLIPDIFISDEYRHRRDEIVKEFTQERNSILNALEKTVQESGFILNMNQEGMMIIPATEGRTMTEDDLNKLTEDQKDNLRKTSELLQEKMNVTAMNIKKLEKKLKEKNKDLDRRIALQKVGFLLEELQEKYKEQRSVIKYLLSVKNDVIKNLNDFKQKEQPAMPFPMQQPEVDFTRYKVNVFVDNTEQVGAPVVFEHNPTYTNLFGTMERKASFGVFYTDFTMIRPGSLHKANGGYLVIRARDLFKWFLSWEAIKRAIKNREIKIEDPYEMAGVMSTQSMKPKPVEMQIKVILIDEPYIYQALYNYDDQFKKLFKVKAHLDDQVNRNDLEINKYLQFAAKVVEQKGIRPVNKHGLARLLEYGVELAGRQKKLTLKMAHIKDILREADYWATETGNGEIGCEQVDKAISHRKFRSSLIEDKMQEHIQDGYVNINTDGEIVGQINGLSVFDLGDYSFGKPSRITASISMGRGGVVAIDRESKLSGNIHTKGVLIMEGYLKSRYAGDRPLSLSASLVFEQMYGMVDGDSASAAELFALLSSLAGVGLKQNLAVTGSISQLGEIQPIGGVNEKIEGFYEVCKERGLNGSHGVIIPGTNVPDLMLKNEIIDAVKNGKFTVYSVSHADEALEILTGMEAGQKQDDGRFPDGTFNRLVEDKLTELMEKAKKLMKSDENNDKNAENGEQ